MKIVSFELDGAQSYGVAIDDGLIDIGARLGSELPDVRAVLTAGALDKVAEVAEATAPDCSLDDITFLQPITNPDVILCVGMNYKSAFAEINGKFPGHPSLFIRRPSSQVGHLQAMQKPTVSDEYDCEAELAVIIGKETRGVTETDAMESVAGYSIFNEASVIDWMRHTPQNVTPGKNWQGSGAFGPWMVTADEVPDPSALQITHRLNSEVIQDDSVNDIYFSIPQLIEYIASFTTLLPGDVISSGSPGGIRTRRDAGNYLKVGDVIEMEIPGIGLLKNTVG